MGLLGAAALTVTSSCLALAYTYLVIGSLFSHESPMGIPAGGGHQQAPAASITMTPPELHVHGTALLDYTPPPPGTPGLAPPLVTASAGEAVPLTPGVFTPGGALPAADTARAAFAGQTRAPVHADGHSYVVFLAPADPGQVTLTFYAGDGTEPAPQLLTGALVVDVKD
jgi:hypothetical protein